MIKENVSLFCRTKGKIEILLYPKKVFAFIGYAILADKSAIKCLSFDSKEVIEHGNFLKSLDSITQKS